MLTQENCFVSLHRHATKQEQRCSLRLWFLVCMRAVLLQQQYRTFIICDRRVKRCHRPASWRRGVDPCDSCAPQSVRPPWPDCVIGGGCDSLASEAKITWATWRNYAAIVREPATVWSLSPLFYASLDNVEIRQMVRIVRKGFLCDKISENTERLLSVTIG